MNQINRGKLMDIDNTIYSSTAVAVSHRVDCLDSVSITMWKITIVLSFIALQLLVKMNTEVKR